MSGTSQPRGPGVLTEKQRVLLAQAMIVELPSTLSSMLGSLPGQQRLLDQCASRGGLVDPQDWSLSLLTADRTDKAVSARFSLFFTETVGGCNCHDDPEQFQDHKVVAASIDLETGNITWQLLDED